MFMYTTNNSLRVGEGLLDSQQNWCDDDDDMQWFNVHLKAD